MARAERVVFTRRDDSGFAAAVKTRVDRYFEQNGLSRKANVLMIVKLLFYVGGFAALYFSILLGGFSQGTLLLLALPLGFFMAAIGINIGHDACHGACSATPWVNKLASVAFELVGANAYTWNISHNIIHHTYTKIVGWDGDMESMPLLRFYARPGARWFHRYQHWYATFLYGFISLVWVFKKDFSHIFGRRIKEYLGKRPPASAYASVIGFKLLHVLILLVVPMIVLPLAPWKVLLGFVVAHYVTGLTLTLIFQLGHCVEGPDFVHPSPSREINDAWEDHQMKTSANFGQGAWWTNWLCGGLNYQIEHHLFPKVCHTHYPALAPIVKQAAEEFGLPYHSYPNFFSGYAAHLRLLKQIGCTVLSPT